MRQPLVQVFQAQADTAAVRRKITDAFALLADADPAALGDTADRVYAATGLVVDAYAGRDLERPESPATATLEVYAERADDELVSIRITCFAADHAAAWANLAAKCAEFRV